MEKMKMSLQDYQKTEGILRQLRIINMAFLAFEILSLMFVNLVAIGKYLEDETCTNIVGFLSEHDVVLMLLAVGLAVMTVLYNIILMKIPFPGVDFLIVGIVGFVSYLYEGSHSSAISSEDSVAITTAVTSAMVSIAILFISRKLYCDAMGKMVADLSEKAQKAWKGLLRLTSIVCILSILLLVVMKYVTQGLYDSLDYWDPDYDVILNTVLIALVVIACSALFVEILLRIRELSCLRVTQKLIKEKCGTWRPAEAQPQRETTRPAEDSWPEDHFWQKEMMKQYEMPEDAPEEEEDDSWLRKKD